VSVTGLAGAGLTREDSGERAGGGRGRFRGRFASSEAVKCGLDPGEIVEGIKTLGASAKLAWRLGAAEHEKAEDCGLVASQVKDGANAVLVLRDAGIVESGDEVLVLKGMERLADLVFGEVEDGVATGLLITGVDECVQGERVVLRCGDLFFDEGAENAGLNGIEHHTYESIGVPVNGVRMQSVVADPSMDIGRIQFTRSLPEVSCLSNSREP
jgi:hypothetical protein